MKTAIIAAISLLVGGAAAQAQYGQRTHSGSSSSYGQTYGTGSNPSSHQSSGYTNSFGMPVQPYHATSPNSTQMDNYSTRGNVNPYNGAVGTRNPKY